MKMGIRILVIVVCLLATIGSLSAIYSDNSELEKQAQQLACPEDPCIRMVEMERRPTGQRFVFQISMDPIQSIEVECKRSMVLFGDYTCQVTGPPR